MSFIKIIRTSATRPIPSIIFNLKTNPYISGFNVVRTFNTYYIESRPLILKKPKKRPIVELPEKRKLQFFEKIPEECRTGKVRKQFKRLIDMRGPEPVNTRLIYKQFGIRALQGGSMRHEHFETIRFFFNKKMDETKCFAKWRVDGPWKPITKKGMGHRMGGGKGSIDHYVTPVRQDAIILEVAGNLEFEQVYLMMHRAAMRLPFKADVVTYAQMEREEKEKAQAERTNINPFNFEYCLKNNFLGSQAWASPYDYIWHNKYR